MYKCKKCGKEEDYWYFFEDEFWDEETDDIELLLQCPDCGAEHHNILEMEDETQETHQ